MSRTGLPQKILPKIGQETKENKILSISVHRHGSITIQMVFGA